MRDCKRNFCCAWVTKRKKDKRMGLLETEIFELGIARFCTMNM